MKSTLTEEEELQQKASDIIAKKNRSRTKTLNAILNQKELSNKLLSLLRLIPNESIKEMQINEIKLSEKLFTQFYEYRQNSIKISTDTDESYLNLNNTAEIYGDTVTL